MQSSIVAILCFVLKSLQPNPSFSVCWTHCLSHLGCIWRHLNSNDVQWWIKIMILKESIFWCEDFSLWRGGGGLKFLAMSPPPQIWRNLITRKANVQWLFSFHTHTHINTNWFYHRLVGKKNLPVVVFQHIRLYFRQAQLRETILGFQVGEPTTSDHHDR